MEAKTTKTPVSSSNHTKSKVKAFQFIEGRPSRPPSDDGAEKENVDPQTSIAESAKIKTDENGLPNKTCLPSTPATRLPLVDLIGNPEESPKRRRSNAMTPEEHVLWQHSISPGRSQPSVTPGRKRKRARSSSPASSSQHETSNFFPSHASGQGAQQQLKPPQHDPAVDLWRRYRTNVPGNDNSSKGKEAVFEHLIKQASPPFTTDAGSVGGLRRWASCGIEWPTSGGGRKRRRTDVGSKKPPDHQSVINSTRVEVEDGVKRSKVDVLLERMKETLSKENERMPSSSSPLPAVGRTDATSPLARLSTMVEDLQETPCRTLGGAHVQDQPVSQKVETSFSEYGDAEIDTEVFEAFDFAEDQTVAHTRIKAMRRSSFSEAKQNSNAFQQNLSEGRIEDHVSDEFGADDDEFFAADLELLVSKYESQSQPQQSGSMLVGTKEGHAEPVGQALSSEDEFDDDAIDMEQFAAAEAAATQSLLATNQPSATSKRAIQRYLIKIIEEGIYYDSNGHAQVEKVLVVEEEKTNLLKSVTLRQAWIESLCSPGSYVHIIGEFSSTGQCIIDNGNNLLILHPDHLISATVVADSFVCTRRAVLQDRVKATSQSSPPTLYGTILHQLFQEAMMANQWDFDFLSKTIEQILPRHFETLVDIGLNLNQAREHLFSKLPEMQAWAEIFVQAEPRADSFVKSRAGQSITMSVSKLLDVEEHVWSPMYGLKGNIDATIQVVMDENSDRRVLTVPFEVKTGKRTSESHIAQTALYTLLLSDRYDLNVVYGILYYLETSEISRVPAIRHEIIHMIMKRNELACYVRERLKLPAMLKKSHMCAKCYAQTTCFLYNKLAENGNGDQIDPKDTFERLVRHLKPSDQAFFKQWDDLISKEESEMVKFRRELWTMVSTQREKLGRCFSNLIVEPGTAITNTDVSKINRHQYTFVKRHRDSAFSFTESQIVIGEPIVISDEAGHFALANGYVTHISKKQITVAVDRQLNNARTRRSDFNSQNNQVFIGLMEVNQRLDNNSQTSPRRATDQILYRLDKDEFSNGMATVRNNLLQIMDNNVFKSADLRSLIIENRSPSFKPATNAYNLLSSSWQSEMNSDQKAAVQKVMTAEDYALVLGMPGTGKTTTIANIIRALVAKGKSVLLTSYTHTAVDNILLKIRNAGFDILRLGVLGKIHPEVQDFAILAAQPKGSLEELSESWHMPPVVATTCLGLNHPLFNQRTFDCCIVDEASQVTLPVCLGPIRMANTFILVGDHFQLPPLVQNKAALEGGLDMSLFRLLSERHPEAIVSLEHQYRMCSDIMTLSNQLIYSGHLKCGNDTVANRSLHIPNPTAFFRHHYTKDNQSQASSQTRICRNSSPSTCHLSTLLSPTTKVLFMNTDSLLPLSAETSKGNRITNATEVTLLIQLAHLLLNAGINPSDLGIVTFYRSQLALLRQSLRSMPGIEVHTADKFQGRDKEVVFVSFVRSNEAGEVGELLKDWRRVNVAITRARSKLVLVGSRKTLLGGGEVLKGLVGICEEKSWLWNLGKDVLENHCFPEMAGSQATQMESPVKKGVVESVREGNGSPRKKVSESEMLRRPLGEIEGRNAQSPTRAKVSKVPQKFGKIRPDRVLKSKPILMDLVNDILGG